MERIRERGAVLLLVLGTLMCLALLGITFVRVQATERYIAGSFTDRARVRMIASSGLEDAVARLKAQFASEGPLTPGAVNDPLTYWGDNDDELGVANTGLRLDLATNPSWALENEGFADPDDNPYTGSPAPLAIVIDGDARGLSGAMATGTYGANTDQYALKVLDAQGQIYINDGIDEVEPYRPVTMNLKRVLDTLGGELGVASLGNLIVDNRPPGGYRSKLELPAFLEVSAYLAVRDYLTRDAWIDTNVANPVPLSAGVLSDYPVGDQYYRGTPPRFRYGRHKDFKGTSLVLPMRYAPAVSPDDPQARVYAMDELNPQHIEITARAPVNVNAAPRPVLVSVLKDLSGFFMLDRRRRNPNDAYAGSAPLYYLSRTFHTYSPTIESGNIFTGQEGDELGILYSTETMPAGDVADEILACRQRTVGPVSGTDYGVEWFGGKFASWRQFNAFCDNLVETDVLSDTRGVFLDHSPTGGNPWGFGSTVVSTEQQAMASRAMADVLEANFNPNLHLNELNPDANLYTRVDKTDLIASSTEFCFTSMGVYEVRSLGRLLQPIGGTDALTAPDNKLVAQSTATGIFRLFDAIRLTHQKDFVDDADIDPIAGAGRTNNALSLEVGPEPDNGVAPSENEWDGFVALPTRGGHSDAAKAPGALVATPSNSMAFPDLMEGAGSRIHAHFNLDDKAHWHDDGAARAVNIAKSALAGEAMANFPPPSGEAYAGPFVPTDGTPGRHRLARSFRLDGVTAPSLGPFAPLNLRVDGLYSERHSGVAYWNSNNIMPRAEWYPQMFSIDADRYYLAGCASYWIKPSFHPETTGRAHMFFNASQSADDTGVISPNKLLHVWVGAHDTAPGVPSINEDVPPGYHDPISPMSMIFGSGTGGTATGSLTHRSHDHAATKPNRVDAHRWTHVAVTWRRHLNGLSGYDPSSTAVPPYWTGWSDALEEWRIYVNGQLVGTSDWTLPGDTMVGHTGFMALPPRSGPKFWHTRADDNNNAVRIGHVSRLQTDMSLIFDGYDGSATIGGRENYRTNFSSDATIDEFYLWGGTARGQVDGYVAQALDHWMAGRYYAPAGDGAYTSGPIDVFASAGLRRLPPASEVAPPSGGGAPATVSATPPDGARIIGMAWTLLGEDVPGDGSAVVLDHQTAPAMELIARIEMSLSLDGTTVAGPFDDDRFSPVDVQVSDGQVVRFSAAFKLDGSSPGTILLSTPVLDDVTIFVERFEPLEQFLE